MTRLRSLVVTATIAGSITLSLAALALDRQLWPFMHYPMYSTLFGPTTTTTRAVGVTADGRELPMPRRLEPRGLMLHVIVTRAERNTEPQDRLTRIATALFVEYERRRVEDGLDASPVTSVRIYRDTIRLATRPHIRRASLLAQGPTR